MGKWEKEMADIDNCTITVEASTSMSFMKGRADYESSCAEPSTMS